MTYGLDTSVVVRLLVSEPPALATKAKDFVEAALDEATEIEETIKFCEEMIDEIRDKVQPEVEVMVNAPKMTAKIHREYLSHILRHLLSNAAEYTPAEGHIWLDYKKRGAHMQQFIVTDTGCGIPEEKMDDVFKPFLEIKDLCAGDGLGLPICKEMAKKMNGDLEIDPKYTKGTRFIINSAIASMGYGLPAAIGLCLAGKRQKTVCMEGDGSIMMNLQELETVAYNRLKVKVFLINNDGYHSIRITQTNLFEANFAGVDPASGVGMPTWEKVAAAFGIPFMRITRTSEIGIKVDEFLAWPGCGLCEVVCGTDQFWAPKLSARRLPDGSMVSPSLEDMAPFLPPDELEAAMDVINERSAWYE